jgi:H2-forming N5,N10-methylenetetrahydromethanopterin dehydrogenase-like enzyme
LAIGGVEMAIWQAKNGHWVLIADFEPEIRVISRFWVSVFGSREI